MKNTDLIYSIVQMDREIYPVLHSIDSRISDLLAYWDMSFDLEETTRRIETLKDDVNEMLSDLLTELQTA